jgi:2-dehydropantoate 2-reductase
MDRITIVGAGAIGGWVAAKLAIAGCRPSVFARGDTLRLMRTEGLLLNEQGEEFIAQVDSTDDCAALGEQDLVIVAVKAPALPALASELRPLIGAETNVVPMLNGVPWWFIDGEPLRSVDPDGRIAAALPLERIVGCVVHASCSRSAPNRIAVKHAEKLIIGEPGGGSSDRVAWLFALLDEAGLKPDITNNVRRSIW